MFRIVWRVVRVVRLDWACCDLSELFGELIEFVDFIFGICSGRSSSFSTFCDLFCCSTSRLSCYGSRSGRSGRVKDGPGSCVVVLGVVSVVW